MLPHLDAAYNLARWLTRNDHDAEDVVQEAVLRACRFADGLRGDPRPWLLAIVRNACFTWLEANRPAELALGLDERIGEIPAPEAEGPEAGLAIVDAITGIDAYQPLHAARADLLRRIGDATAADAAYERAIELSSNPVQRSFLERRRAELSQ